jgi:NAD(P)-dependent dehydrogenase (short-subunit alcohol dehydrogenase family)
VDEVAFLQAAAEYVQTHVGSLNLLLNVTGVLHSPEGLAPERALAKVEAANLLQSYHVNAVGPTMVTRAFAPLLQTTAAATQNRCATSA